MEAAAAVNARAEEFSRISAVARRDMDQYYSGACSELAAAPEPPWIARRRKEALQTKEKQAEQEHCVKQVSAMAFGMGEQVGAMQRQLEEQSRQLKSLAVGHCAQTSLQKQLMTLFTTAQQSMPENPAPAPRTQGRKKSPDRTATQEYTLTWLNAQRHGGKHERSGVHGYRPLRKSFFHNELHRIESGSDRTRTTFGGTRRRFFPRSVISIPTEATVSKKEHVVEHSKAKELVVSPRKKPPKVPLVAALYAKCRRKSGKRPSPRKAEKRTQSRKCKSNTAEKPQPAEDQELNYKETYPPKADIKTAPLEDSILDSMLSVRQFEDELKHRWLVPEVGEQEKNIEPSILDEMMNYKDATPRSWKVVRDTVERKCSKKQGSLKSLCRESLVETILEDVLIQVCSELLSFCDEFVEHMYMSEFLGFEGPD